MDAVYNTTEKDGKIILTKYRGHHREVVIPSSIEVIGRNAFRRNMSLTELVIPSNVRIIEPEAFNGCISLKKVTFEEGIREIGSRAFWACSGLTELIFPMSLTYIGPRAFEACVMLNRIRLKNPGTVISENAFRESPYFITQMHEAMQYMHGSGSHSGLSGRLRLPEGITHIDNWCFANSAIPHAWLPNSLRTIGMSAFKGCKELKSVSMSPNTYCNYASIMDSTDGIFSGCVNLESVELRGPLESYIWDGYDRPVLLRGLDPERTFLHCRSLRTITAYEVPLSAFPAQWRTLAVNGFVKDAERDIHYPAEIANEYHEELRHMKKQLLARTQYDPDPAVFQYLIEYDMILLDEIDQLIDNAKNQPETLASLLAHKRKLQAASGHSNVFDLLDI